MTNGSIKRILVALDASEANHSALQAAALLASQLQAELQALFVEDINLLRLAELPFAREMMFGSHEGRRITLTNMERQIQAQASRLRQLVEATAQQARIKAEFKVLRGQISSELLLATQQRDLLILGKNAQFVRPDLKLGKVAQEILASVNCNVMLVQHGAQIERPVVVLFDGSQASQRALLLGMQLAHGDHDHLTVIYPVTSPERQAALQQAVSTITQPIGINPGQMLLTGNSTSALLQSVAACKGRILIVESGSETLNPEAVKSLVQQSPVPVIVMRE